MAHFSEQVHISVGSFPQNIIYYDLTLSQKMADHHHFSFVWQYTGKAVIKPADQAKALRSYLGDEVIFTFKSLTGIRLMSKGIITELSSVDLNGSAVGLHVKGISHSIVLDDMKKSRTYLENGMNDIVRGILSEGPTEFYQRESIKSTYLKQFKYLAQYNETSFEFLKRLALRYGQWFYFDGMRMQFGQTQNTKIKLINGASLHSFKIQANMASHKISLGGYDYNNALGMRNSAAKTTEGSKDSFASVVGYNQGTVVQPDLSGGAYSNNAQSKEEIEEMVKLQTAGSDANSVYYSGISYLPLGLGQVFTIVNQTVEHELVVIEAVHHSEVHGNYFCEFKAIPADVAAPHYTDVHVFANAETQPAKIIDNNDPEGLGRVKVEFYWAAGSKSSDWMRLIQPHSGAGKGFYFIPEIGEEVLVGFEGANAQAPYVMGAQYNGKQISGYNTPKNDIKAIQTRSGIKIIFNDDENSLLIEDPSGNKYFMDGKGNTFVTAPKNMTFDIGEDLTINVGKNMTTQVGEDQTTDVSKNKSTTVTNKISLQAEEYKQNIDKNKTIDIGGDLKETTSTTTHKATGGDILIRSSGVSKVLGAIDAKVNKG